MIAKMKKLTFLVYHKEYEDFLKEIREVGVVHVVEKAQGGAGNAELQDSIRLSSRYAAAVKTLRGMGVLAGASHAGDVRKGEEALKEIEALQQEMQRLSHQAQLTDKDIAVLEPWETLSRVIWPVWQKPAIALISMSVRKSSSRKNG